MNWNGTDTTVGPTGTGTAPISTGVTTSGVANQTSTQGTGTPPKPTDHGSKEQDDEEEEGMDSKGGKGAAVGLSAALLAGLAFAL